MAAVDLTSLENVKENFDIKQPDSDALLSRLITAASVFVLEYLSRDLALATHSLTFSGHGGRTYIAPQYPVTEITSLSIDGVTIPPRSSVLGNGYAFDELGIYLTGYSFTRGQMNVSLTYKAGYASIPEPVEQAVIELVGLKYRERGRLGKTSETLNGMTTAYLKQDMTDNMKTALDLYKRRHPA